MNQELVMCFWLYFSNTTTIGNIEKKHDFLSVILSFSFLVEEASNDVLIYFLFVLWSINVFLEEAWKKVIHLASAILRLERLVWSDLAVSA